MVRCTAAAPAAPPSTVHARGRQCTQPQPVRTDPVRRRLYGTLATAVQEVSNTLRTLRQADLASAGAVLPPAPPLPARTAHVVLREAPTHNVHNMHGPPHMLLRGTPQPTRARQSHPDRKTEGGYTVARDGVHRGTCTEVAPPITPQRSHQVTRPAQSADAGAVTAILLYSR